MTQHRFDSSNWKKAVAFVRREMSKVASRSYDGAHPSFAAAKILQEAEKKFSLPSYGVEGWAKTPSKGVSYLNMGDPYETTIYVRTWPHRHSVSLGSWGDLAEREGE